MRRFIHELERRNVHRVAAAYLAGSWLLIQILETIFPIFGLEESGIRWVVLVLVVCFIPVLSLSWAFEWSPRGVRTQAEIDRDPDAAQSTGRTLDRIIIAVLSVAVLFFAVDKFVLGPTSTSKTSAAATIAVLPFQDMSATQDQAYFGDGLAEELLNLLAKNPALKVAARTSSFSFRESSLAIQDIARQLRVEHVLEGSVRRDGDRIRVTAQLISAENGYNVWSEAYDASLTDIFSIQGQISSEIAHALQPNVLGSVSAPRKTDPEAYALHLQAKYVARQGSQQALEQAEELLQQVLAIDPEYVPALGNLAAVYSNLATGGHRNRDRAFRLAREAALRAVSIDPNDAGGYFRLAWIAQWYDGDMEAAIEYMQKALELEPNEAAMLGNAAVLLLHIGKLEESIALQEYSASQSPVDPTAFFNLGLAYLYADRLEDAEKSLRKVLQLSPEYGGAGFQLGQCLLLMGRADEALQIWRRIPEGFDRLTGEALAAFDLGRQAESDAALAALIQEWGEQWPSTVVHVHAYRGDIDQAFEWLEKEYDKFGAAGWGEWRLQRLFDNLRGDPRWESFLERVGTSNEQLAQYEFDVAIPSRRD